MDKNTSEQYPAVRALAHVSLVGVGLVDGGLPQSAATVGDTRTPFNPNNPRMNRVQSIGHLQRKGHALTGYYLTTDGLSTLVRTCCDEATS